MSQVAELGTVKSLSQRIAALRLWNRDGGVMIMGYDNYRIMSSAKKISSEELKKELQSVLVDPGTVSFTDCLMWSWTAFLKLLIDLKKEIKIF